MSRFLTAATVTLSALTAGCGDPELKTAPVKGRLVTRDGGVFRVQRPGGLPLPPGDPGFRAKFVRVGEPPPGADSEYHATVNTDAGTFEVPGPANRGIPPGQYRVHVFSAGAAGGKGFASGPPGARTRTPDGVEVVRREVTVPGEGLTDLTIEVEVK